MSKGSGKRFNDGKIRVELLPPMALFEVARVLEFGAKKYGDTNWLYGMGWRTVIGSTLRHTFKFMLGENRDDESQCLHAAHIACNSLFLVQYLLEHPELDDRCSSYAQLKEKEDEEKEDGRGNG